MKLVFYNENGRVLAIKITPREEEILKEHYMLDEILNCIVLDFKPGEISLEEEV